MRSNDANALVERDANVFFHQSGSSPHVKGLRSVGGIWLEDMDGSRLIDLHGNTAHHIGYAHPRLIAALKTQLDELPFCPRRFTNEPAVALAEKLTARWTGAGKAKALFATGGSDAIEIAVRLARAATGRSGTISLEGSYHGHGFAALGLSRSNLDPRLGEQLQGRTHVTPYWDHLRGGGERMLEEIAVAFRHAKEGIAAVVAEPIRSNCHVPPSWLWHEVRKLCDANGACLIFDEIPSGLGKTGRFFAHEHFGVAPDAVVLGKALGGGVAPIAAVIADARLDVAPDLDIGHYTHEKNPLTTRAALTTLEIIEDEDLVRRAETMGRYALQQMAKLAEDIPIVVGGRGLGLLLALEFTEGTGLVGGLIDKAYQEGVSIVPKGSDAIGFSTPLIISTEDIDEALKRIRRAL
ncbi:MAG: aminotransferase class III-fold pyridoxal phosphate-dependent enzyme [Beijerinckiaceae bacterium]